MPTTLNDQEVAIALHWYNGIQSMGGRGEADNALALKLIRAIGGMPTEDETPAEPVIVPEEPPAPVPPDPNA